MALLVAITVSVATFVLLDFGTDPAAAIAGADAPQEVVEQIRTQYGLDRPMPVRYAEWLGGVLQGDLGQSFLRRQPVGSLILTHAPVTLILSLAALAVTILTAIPLGIVAALRPNSLVDRFALSVAVAGLEGAASLLKGGAHPLELASRVTSPAGTTIQGVRALERAGFTAAVMEAVEAAARKANEFES